MDGRTDVRMDILYSYSGYFKPWPTAAYAARNYGLRFYDRQNPRWTTRQRDKEEDIEKADTEAQLDPTGVLRTAVWG